MIASWLWFKARDVESRQLDQNTTKDAENRRLKTKRDKLVALADEAGRGRGYQSSTAAVGGRLMTIESCDRDLVKNLETFTNPSEVPAPKFELFEVAVLEWISGDDGTVRKRGGTGHRMIWSPVTSREGGWWYYARSLYPPFGGYLPAGHEEECSEDALKKCREK